jgi:myo-inositol 2-dehydrogenase / D-chiro-inositol 1-dehydrogenase
MYSKLRIGVIGTGKIGRLHLESVINHISQGVVVQVADPFIDQKMIDWLEERGVSNVTKEPEELIRNSGVDAVMICSPTDKHAEQIVMSAQEGKHIFCEKPVDFDLQRIVETLKIVKDSGVKFQIGFNRRFDHNFRRIRDVVESGKIGEPHIVKISSRDPAPPPMGYVRSSGGLFMDMMIHDFDMIRFLVGENPVSIFAKGGVLIEPEIGKVGDVDTAVVTMDFPNGSLGIIDNSRQAVYGYDQRAEVFGSKGCCQTENDTDTRVSVTTAEGVSTDVPPNFFLERYFWAYVDEMRGFVQAVLDDREPSPGLEDAIIPVIMAKAAMESFKSGAPVRLEDILAKKQYAFLFDN